MHRSPKGCAARRLALVLLLAIGAIGCTKQPAPAGGPGVTGFAEKPYCGDKTVNANANTGADPQAVYVCEGDTVTWVASPSSVSFTVEFKKDSPFNDNGKQFSNGNPKSDHTKHHDKLKVYEYKITVNSQVFDDPQVIGGGKP
jgi:plastocyanin